MNKILRLGKNDVINSFKKYEYIWIITIHNLKQTYTKTKLGLLWIPLNKIIFGIALGVLYGSLFKQNLSDYLPYVMAGIIIWQFISASISTGMRSFSVHANILHYFGTPKFVFLLQVQLQQLVEFVMLIPVLLLIGLFIDFPSITSLLLMTLGLFVVLLNLFWVSGLLSIFSLFYRDIEQLVDMSTRLLFLVTPIIWKVESLSGRAQIMEWNPFYHMVELIREPLLEHTIDLNVVLFYFFAGIIGNLLLFVCFSYQRNKIVYLI